MAEKQKVRQMFDDIAPTYNFLNNFLSVGIHKVWKRRLISLLRDLSPKTIIDIATGTGDLAILAGSLKPEKILAVDISEKMIEIGRKRAERKSLSPIIDFQLADAENLPLEDHWADAGILSFGLRNFENPEAGLAEISRVIKDEGHLFILEFSEPTKYPMKQLYRFYFQKILPVNGRIFSHHQDAYQYLPDSVAHFPAREELCSMITANGFSSVTYTELSRGVACLYVCEK